MVETETVQTCGREKTIYTQSNKSTLTQSWGKLLTQSQEGLDVG